MQHLVHQHFIDSKVTLRLPETWLSDCAKEKNDSHVGEGTFDALTLNLNNEERIRIPWSSKETTAILSAVLVEYNKVMKNYTAGPGGGDGDPVAYSVWQAREELGICNYVKVESKIYLTIIHLWDKEFNFLMTVVKVTVPSSVAVEDSREFGGDRDDDLTDNGTAQSSRTPPCRSPTFSNTSRAAASNQQVVALMNASRKARHDETQEMTSRFVSVLESNLNPSMNTSHAKQQTEHQVTLQNAIAHTTAQIATYRKGLESLKKQKRKAVKKFGDIPQSRGRVKKLQAIEKKTKCQRGFLKTYETTLKTQFQNLRNVNASRNGEGVAYSESSVCSDSDSECADSSDGENGEN